MLPELAQLGAESILNTRLARPIGPAVVRSVSAVAQRTAADALIGVMQRDRAVAVRAAQRANLPAILAVQNQHHFRGRPLVRLVKSRHYKRAVRHASLALCTSEVVREEMISYGLDAAHAVVLPNGIQTGRPHPLPGTTRSDLAISPETTLLLNVGRLDPQKGQDVLLRALARLGDSSPWSLMLAGTTTPGAAAKSSESFANELHNLATRSSLEGGVTFLGWRSDTAQLLADSDVYVHAARWEGPALPLAVMEAMEAGVPCVLTDCSGIAPGFEAGVHGEVAHADDVDSLASAIQRLLSRPMVERAKIGLAGQQLIRARYDITNVARTFVDHVEAIVSANDLT